MLSNSVENTSLDCADLRGRSREGTKKRALENKNKKHRNYRVEIWAGGALLFTRSFTTANKEKGLIQTQLIIAVVRTHYNCQVHVINNKKNKLSLMKPAGQLTLCCYTNSRYVANNADKG